MISRCPRLALASLGALGAWLAVPAAASAAEERPAGGAEFGQVIIATAGGLAGTLVLLALVVGHRTGRIPLFARLAAVAERATGIRGWASLPAAVLTVSLTIAVFGMYWDISTHIDNGRDPGPLANPAHYFILVGLFGVLFAGVMAVALPLQGAGRAEVVLPNRWRAPVGALIITACGSFSLIAFPLDDVWHRLFGQDVTLWGPTHLMLIGGAGLSVLGALMLHVEGLGGQLTRRAGLPAWTRHREFAMCGALLIGLSTFQAEFDFAVPQFRLIFHPVLLTMAAGIALVAARIRGGRGAALAAVGIFLLVRGALTVTVGPVLGHTTPKFPLYIGAAVAVELIGLRFAAEKRPLAFGAIAGLGIATLGMAVEFGWTHVFFVNPWPLTASFLLEALVLCLIMGVAAGVLGGFVGRALTPLVERDSASRWAVPAAAAVGFAVLAFTLPMPSPEEEITAAVTTREIDGPPERTIAATVKLDPADAAEDAEWLNFTGWQGDGSVVDPLKETGPGTYETTKAIPVHGNWKTTLRLQSGRAVLGLPVYFPEDPAIPVKGIPAEPQFTREFIFDKDNLQREQKKGVSPVLTLGAYLAVLALALALIAAIALGLRRVERSHIGTSGEPPPPAPEPRPGDEPARRKPGPALRPSSGARV